MSRSSPVRAPGRPRWWGSGWSSCSATEFRPTPWWPSRFTERAAEELKNRIAHRVEDRLGRAALDRLTSLFVGTIHAFCFRLLQQRVPRYETYDVLDDNQLTAFLSREAERLELRQLDPNDRLFASIAAFLKGVDVVENELLDPATLPDPFGAVLRAYYGTLERYRLLTYGQQVVRAVRELEPPELAAEVHDGLRHLIVDEYQNVNPAQERLVQLLAGLLRILPLPETVRTWADEKHGLTSAM